jgi:dipeptide/tripeptide permease
MAMGMFLTALSFFILYFAAKSGEGQMPTAEQLNAGSFRVTERSLENLAAQGMPADVVARIKAAKDEKGKFVVLDKKFSKSEDGAMSGQQNLQAALTKVLGADAASYQPAIMQQSYIFRVSPLWLILAYAVISLGELMLSPMGLSLVSKVAPVRMRGLLMGGWFVATAIGNKLTAIGVYWTYWNQSSFFVILGGMAFVMAIVLLVLLRPLKKAMPGI